MSFVLYQLPVMGVTIAMTQDDLNDLTTLPRFTVGEIVSINGISFEITHIAGRSLQLLVSDTQTDKWRAFGQGIVEQLREQGLFTQLVN